MIKISLEVIVLFIQSPLQKMGQAKAKRESKKTTNEVGARGRQTEGERTIDSSGLDALETPLLAPKEPWKVKDVTFTNSASPPFSTPKKVPSKETISNKKMQENVWHCLNLIPKQEENEFKERVVFIPNGIGSTGCEKFNALA